MKALVETEGTSLSADVEKYFLARLERAGIPETALEKIRTLMTNVPPISDEEIERRIHDHRMKN